MLGELTPVEIERALHTATVGRIGCHADGHTYVVPISFAYDGGRIIAHSPMGKKIELMRKNPDVCFEIDQVDDLVNWRSVLAWGRFRELAGAEASAAFGLLIERLRPLVSGTPVHGHALNPPSRAVPGSSTIVFAIELQEKSGRFERQTF